jgi:hypothetical protein
MDKKIVYLIILLLFMNIVSASLGVFKQNDCVNIRTILNTSSVNISTISYPNSSLAVSNQEMTKNALTFNYTFCNTKDLGNYIYDYFDAEGNVYVNDFKITLTGTEQTSAQATGSLGFLILMIFLMVFFGWLGLTLVKNSYLWVIGIFFLFLCALFLVYNTYLGYEYHLLLTGMPNSNTPQMIFYIFMVLMLAGILVSLGLLFLHWKKLFRYIKKEIRRKEDNYEDVEDWDYENWGKGHDIKPAFRK